MRNNLESKSKNFSYFLIDIFCKILSFFIPVNSNKVFFVKKGSSGSNTQKVAKRIKEKYPELDIVEINFDKPLGTSLLKHKIKLYKQALTSKIVVTTHGALLKTDKNISINLWHAFPTKKAGLMMDDISARRIADSTDYFLSYSSFSTILLNSRYGMKASKYIELGSPRNDYLFSKSDRDPSFLKEFKDYKIVYYLPTFREKDSSEYRKENLRFKNFDFESFNNFLKENKILFIMKFHQNEEKEWWDIFSERSYSNIKLIKEEYLSEGYDDFYQILPYSDLLITDYSSIYVDYLLLDKPMIFTPTNMDNYNKERGLLLEPYDFWRPGPKCLTQECLEEEIKKCFSDEKYYKKEREQIKSIFHEYYDGKSTERVVDFIYSKLRQ